VRKIIYHSAGGNPWWDCKQLLDHIEQSVSIFEEAFPTKQALVIFDNSSAHNSLSHNALKAFEMNKSNGSKQRCQ